MRRRERRSLTAVLLAVLAVSARGSIAFAQDGAPAGAFEPPEDTENEDAALPPGTIAVELRDADDRGVPGEEITLGMIVSSVAKGDSRRHVQRTTDAAGRAVFSDLGTESNIAYRVSTGYQGGSFAALPFQLQQGKSMHVVLHVYPVSTDLRLVVCEAVVAVDVRDDRMQVEEALTVYNLGRTAWRPDDVRMALPAGYTAFNAQASMSDQGVDDVGGAARLHGTFPPGRHDVEFRWQVPWSDVSDLDIPVGMPPHVAIARAMMPSMPTSPVRLSADGFPPTQLRRSAEGQSFQVTERHLKPEEPRLTSLSVQLRGLPTRGWGRVIATVLAVLGVGVGLYRSLSKRRPSQAGGGPEAARSVLLAELEALEQAKSAGDVGPRTYERARREIIDAIARSLVTEA